MPAHGDVNEAGLMYCEVHLAYVDVEDRHLDAFLGRPPLLRETPHDRELGDWVEEE